MAPLNPRRVRNLLHPKVSGNVSECWTNHNAKLDTDLVPNSVPHVRIPGIHAWCRDVLKWHGGQELQRAASRTPDVKEVTCGDSPSHWASQRMGQSSCSLSAKSSHPPTPSHGSAARQRRWWAALSSMNCIIYRRASGVEASSGFDRRAHCAMRSARFAACGIPLVIWWRANRV